MKLVLFLFTFCIFSHAKEGLIIFHPNKVHSLFYFLDSVSGNPNTSKTLKQNFYQSEFYNDKAKKELEEFQKIIRMLPSFSFRGFPDSRHVGANVRELLVTQSIFSSDIEDFSKRTLGMLPQEKHSRLIKLMTRYEAVYDAHLWSKTKDKLEKYLKKFKSSFDIEKSNEAYKKIIKFYGSAWPEITQFHIGVYPINCKRGHTVAESLGSVETIGVCIDSNAYKEQWGVTFHEMCHSIYQNQPADFQKKMETVFLESKSKYAAFAYNYLNEVLATAIGNGWFPKLLTGKLDKTNWYNNKYIDTMAKAMFPEIDNYLSKSRTLDQPFLEKYISMFGKKFPESIYEFENIFSNIMVFADLSKHNKEEFRKSLSSNFRIRSWNFYDDNSLSEIKRHMNYSVGDSFIFLLGDKSMRSTQELVKLIPLLNKNRDKLFNPNGHFVDVDSDGRAYIVLNENAVGNYLKLMQMFKRNKLVFKK